MTDSGRPAAHLAVRLGFAVLSLLLLAVALTDRFYWQPSSDAPARPTPSSSSAARGRLTAAERLVSQGYAPVLVATNSVVDPAGGCPAVAARTKGQLICFIPDPFSTRGEARSVSAIAASHGWHRLLLVVSTTQASRARVRFRRCYSGGLRVVTVGVAAGDLPYLTSYEVAATGKAEFAERGC